MNKLVGKKIYVAGHRGMVGSAICKQLSAIDCELLTRTSTELDLRNQQATAEFIEGERPDVVIIAAAKVGGIYANNTYPAEFVYDNLVIASNLTNSCHEADTTRLLFLGSSCIYPKLAPQPISESSLLTGPLEQTNEAYAIGKIAGLKLCEYYRKQYGRLYHSAMPCNLYGPGDNYHPENSHVLPALIRRFHEAKQANAKEVVVWGTGTPLREFLFSDDLAKGCLYLLNLENPPNLVNIGSGAEISIGDLAITVAKEIGYEGSVSFDPSKPDGTPRKLMDNSLINSLGWSPDTNLEQGIKLAYKDYLATCEA